MPYFRTILGAALLIFGVSVSIWFYYLHLACVASNGLCPDRGSMIFLGALISVTGGYLLFTGLTSESNAPQSKTSEIATGEVSESLRGHLGQ